MASQYEEILYTYNNNVYLNITNKCPCSCVFCIRSQTDALGSAESLWLKYTPKFEDVKKAIDDFDFTGYDEIIFCGYGEPTNAFDVLIQTAKYIRETLNVKIRVNTNGLGNLINERNIVKELCENVDSISISLNNSNEKDYQETVRSRFGIKSFNAMLDFAKECKKYTDDVRLSVVDVIGKEEIEKCQSLADSIGIALRVREFTTN